ncbi:MAG: hypothetical protein ACT4O5_11890 [Gammaproteobacteria bacterium]
MKTSPIGTRKFPTINNLAIELTPITGGIGSTRLDFLEAGTGHGSAAARCEAGNQAAQPARGRDTAQFLPGDGRALYAGLDWRSD